MCVWGSCVSMRNATLGVWAPSPSLPSTLSLKHSTSKLHSLSASSPTAVLAPTQPSAADALATQRLAISYNNLGSALKLQGRWAESQACYSQVSGCRVTAGVVWVQRGVRCGSVCMHGDGVAAMWGVGFWGVGLRKECMRMRGSGIVAMCGAERHACYIPCGWLDG